MPPATPYPYHFEAAADITAPAESLFAYLDDPRRMAAHMERSSWMMVGGKMLIETDAMGGRALGSEIRLSGTVLRVPLYVSEVVKVYEPPRRKVWATVGEPRLLVIGAYRMAFEIVPATASSQLHVLIDYFLPGHAPWRWLGALVGHMYARWCTRRMVSDAMSVKFDPRSPLATR